MRKIKENKGITLIALIVAIIVLLILASISLKEGTSLIKKAKVENYITNMITIRASAKVYAEEINAKIWNLSGSDKIDKREELFKSEYNMECDVTLTSAQEADLNIENNEYEAYRLTEETLKDMGLDDIKDDTNYVVVYDSSDYTKLDIVYIQGIIYEKTTYYTLSALQTAIGE